MLCPGYPRQNEETWAIAVVKRRGAYRIPREVSYKARMERTHALKAIGRGPVKGEQISEENETRYGKVQEGCLMPLMDRWSGRRGAELCLH